MADNLFRAVRRWWNLHVRRWPKYDAHAAAAVRLNAKRRI